MNDIRMAMKNVSNYKIKILNVVNFAKSIHYISLKYVENEQAILKITSFLLRHIIQHFLF